MSECSFENDLTSAIIGAAIEVHRHLGPGLLESAYDTCMQLELRLRGVPFRSQVSLPLEYKGHLLDQAAYRVDMIVGDVIVVELKAVESLRPVHSAQLLTYLKLLDLRFGLLVNFDVPVLRQGIKRVINGN
jgi:GxxExxY protein